MKIEQQKNNSLQQAIVQELEKHKFKKIHLEGEKIVKNSIKKGLNEEFGHNFSRDFIDFLKTKTAKEEEILYDYQLLSDVIKSKYSKDITETLFHSIDSKIYSTVRISENNKDIKKIITKYNKDDVIKRINSTVKPQNIVMFFSNKTRQEEILEEFFDPIYSEKSITGLFAHQQKDRPGVKTILYKDIEGKNNLNIDLILEFFGTVYQKNNKNTTKFACSDTAWFTKKGYSKEHEQVVSKLDKSIKNNSIILCCYNLNSITKSHLEKILQAKPIIILADTYSIYHPKQTK